ncbi:unnamed protein product [Cochlearia groenlandica]
MEKNNKSSGRFLIAEEDHTLANSVRFVLNQDPRVTEAAYIIPHPSLESVNIHVKTTGDPAREVLKDACQELMAMNRHVRGVFDKAVAEFKSDPARLLAEEEELKTQMNQIKSMDIETN